jgi:hypothetical protein
MIDYQTYCQIRHLFTEKQLGLRQIARALKLGLNTVRKWARRESFKRAPMPKRHSKLDPFKGDVIRLLEQHDYSARAVQYAGKESYELATTFVVEVTIRLECSNPIRHLPESPNDGGDSLLAICAGPFRGFSCDGEAEPRTRHPCVHGWSALLLFSIAVSSFSFSADGNSRNASA